MNVLEKILEEINDSYRVVKNDEDLEWNRAIDRCQSIIHKCTEGIPDANTSNKRLIDADVLDEEVRNFLLAITGNPKQATVVRECKESFRKMIDEQPTAYEANDWIPCSKRLPEQERWVLATVMHSAWVSDYDSKWVKKEEKIHHQKSFGTYLAHVNTFGKWIFLDEGYETTCEKEVGNDHGRVYDVAVAWQPLPEPYRAADSKPDWKEHMLNTFLAGH